MPELPEVETIKLGLRKKITGLKITDVEILNSKTFQGDAHQVKGATVVEVWRRAKMLGIDLKVDRMSLDRDDDNIVSLLFHLKMTGQLIYKSQNYDSRAKIEDVLVGGHPTQDMLAEMPNKSTRVVFTFSDRSKLYFNDQRKFGWVRVSSKQQAVSSKLLVGLGPEPLEKEFNWQVLKTQLLKRKSLPVKVALMDQSVLSGVGNIYASEACFDARIDPRTKVKDLTDKQFKRTHTGVIKSLQDGIKHGGSSRANFVNVEGKKGYFLDYAFVYGREGDQCKKCGTKIKKIKLGGRGTYLCPRCQK